MDIYKPSPVQLATRYLQSEWAKLYPNQVPPLELTEGVVHATVQLGYTRSLVDKMITAYRANSKNL